MKLNEIKIPNKYEEKDFKKLNPMNYQEMINILKNAHNTYKMKLKKEKKELKAKDNNYIEFKRYCTLQYIKYADFVHYNHSQGDYNSDDSNWEVKANTLNDIYGGLTIFLSAIVTEDDMPKRIDEAIKGYLKFLEKNFYITTEERPDDYRRKSKFSSIPTCNLNIEKKQKEIVNYIEKKCIHNEYSDLIFKINQEKTNESEIDSLEYSLTNIYKDDIASIERYFETINRREYTTHIMISVKTDSDIYNILNEITNKTNSKKK